MASKNYTLAVTLTYFVGTVEYKLSRQVSRRSEESLTTAVLDYLQKEIVLSGDNREIADCIFKCRVNIRSTG